ncbi:MAG: hypothetical protein KJ795_03705 [Gammaproteobacteria bacterium]|nr:hypothetical protein [Gammaproteobacteria bacterium]MBU1777095.1 hypothetical protein [Gammaproteobacteria bacterium]MBU1967877.1 hypothetical protein [Gammaproteobacteria bacterium]
MAALTGLQSFFWQFLDRRDRILVKLGSFRPPSSPGEGLFVVNKSKHLVELHDYGFVLSNGGFFSLPNYFENEGCQDQVNATFAGSSALEPRERFEVYVDLTNIKIVGAYARTTTQNRDTVCIGEHLNFFYAWWCRVRVWWHSLFRH